MSPNQAQNLNRCLLGGTFDRFHIGHEKLITCCLDRCADLEIWLTSDEMVKEKTGDVQSFKIRKQVLEEYFQRKGAFNRISIHELVDEKGPAPTRDDCDAIGCTSETRHICEQINSLRLINGLKPLEIIEVAHKLNEYGVIISSSSIRAGIMNGEGELWLSDDELGANHKMPSKLDSELKEPIGTLFKGPESDPSVAMTKVLEKYNQHKHRLIAVGDVAVKTLIDMDIIPSIGVVDGQTKRKELPSNQKVNESLFSKILTCNNDPGTISSEFKHSLKKASISAEKTIVMVKGEEDLAPLILHLCLQIGDVVIYGQPKEGLVVKVTDEDTKNNCKRLLSLFEKF